MPGVGVGQPPEREAHERMMTMHKCFDEINKKLGENNTQLALAFNFAGDAYITIATEKVNIKTRRGPIKITAAYCPFCGKGLGSIPRV